MSLLEVQDVHVRYGGIEAVKGISFEVGEGELVTLIGGNGAGKTTTLKTVSGLKRPSEGSILFDGRPIDSVPAHEIVDLGICQSPEGRRIFPRMSVHENLEMGAYGRKDHHHGLKDDYDRVYNLFPVLRDRQKQKGGTLSGGEQQMLAIGRALMGEPRLLCWTNRPWAWPPSSWKRSSDYSKRSTIREPRSCWSSKTPKLPCASPTAVRD